MDKTLSFRIRQALLGIIALPVLTVGLKIIPALSEHKLLHWPKQEKNVESCWMRYYQGLAHSRCLIGWPLVWSSYVCFGCTCWCLWKGNFGLGRGRELEQVRRTAGGYPGIKVRMRRLEAWIASLFWQQLAFLFSKGNSMFIQPEN